MKHNRFGALALSALLFLTAGCSGGATSTDDTQGSTAKEEKKEEQFVLKTSTDRHVDYVNKYIGLNAATVGYTSLGGQRRDYIGQGNVLIEYVTEDGTYVGVKNEEDLKNWKVVTQSPAPNTEVKFVYSNDGEEDADPSDGHLSWMNLFRIELGVVPVGSKDKGPELTDINLPSDKYTFYIRDYVGKNLRAVGYTSLGGDYRDAYGDANIQLVIAPEDGSYIDIEDEGTDLSKYVITGQSIPANTEVQVTYEQGSDGEDYHWADTQSVTQITLNVRALEEAE